MRCFYITTNFRFFKADDIDIRSIFKKSDEDKLVIIIVLLMTCDHGMQWSIHLAVKNTFNTCQCFLMLFFYVFWGTDRESMTDIARVMG